MSSSEDAFQAVKSEASMATKQSKETLLKILAEIDSVFQHIDSMDRAITAKEQALDHLERESSNLI